MLCPQCYKDTTKVLWTRKLSTHVARGHKCSGCGWSFESHERTIMYNDCPDVVVYVPPSVQMRPEPQRPIIPSVPVPLVGNHEVTSEPDAQEGDDEDPNVKYAAEIEALDDEMEEFLSSQQERQDDNPEG